MLFSVAYVVSLSLSEITVTGCNSAIATKLSDLSTVA